MKNKVGNTDSVKALRKYLKNTPKDVLEEEWKQIEALGIQGPTLSEILASVEANVTISPGSP